MKTEEAIPSGSTEHTYPLIVLSWAIVMHSNHRLRIWTIRSKSGQAQTRLSTAPDYRQAKESAEIAIRTQWRGQPKLTGPVELYARCFFPDKRKRDAVGYAKMIDDAMTGIVYEDDSQLYRETWERSGIDRENPRVELVITELSRSNKG